ncbi:MAG: class II aldolase/adducin family protein [Alphaproteobacteria bacterium]|nr:class II aldolase/adducin family protein [Alphaproteobacteria bacterium]
MASTVTAMPARMSAEEWQTRCDLAACYRLVDLFGWSDLINTRITARVPDSDGHFLINRYGLLFDEVTASSLVKIDREGNKVEPSDYEVNSGGFAIPSAVHMARSEIACVLHTHSIAGCAVSMQQDGLLPLNQHALQIIADVAYHDYEGTGRNPEERARLLADFGDRHIMVLRNHGLLIVGTSIAAAFVATYRMERACAMQLAFRQSGAEFHPINDDVVRAAYDNVRSRLAGRNDPTRSEWPALLRKLDRIDPSYKE